jgi:uncharacterized protein YjeT (DUF2065 family)
MLRGDEQMDNIYMFTFVNLKLIFAGICLAVLLEGAILFFVPGRVIRWWERISRRPLRLIGIAEIILSLGALYFVLYR